MKKILVVAWVLCWGAFSASAKMTRSEVQRKLEGEFPAARVQVDGKTAIRAMLEFPVGRPTNIDADPVKVATDFLEAHAGVFGLRGIRVVRSSDADDSHPAVVRLEEAYGPARIEGGSDIIVHVRGDQVSRVSTVMSTTVLSDDLKRRLEALKPDPMRAWQALFDDTIERTGKDPRESRWFPILFTENLALYPELVVVPEKDWIVYSIHYGPQTWWIDAETFEIRLGSADYDNSRWKREQKQQ